MFQPQHMEVFQMSQRTNSTHRIRIAAPIAQCHRFFTPAGEELWVDGWNPTYLFPHTGHTEKGMVFTTGSGEDFTLWNLVDFDTVNYYSRYTRVTPALRTGTVEVRCKSVDDETTEVDVTYTLTALTDKGRVSLKSFEGEAFSDMIGSWQRFIEQHLPFLLSAQIR